ncbi:YibE/F family protein [Bacillus lacus]|uniref:YibE/F family protein n=1 Tax=Metabacillus lacus TaxID=1983721 RepID=A0A7X2IY25_9BACI|nr:YibE/F family protein [Metabacillus lacus]MRX71927.1 YibE/F family protein [Metabacillus lacus]
MNALVLLAAILLLLMMLIGGKKGVRSFLALFLNFSVVFITVIFMNDPNRNPVVLTLLAALVISCINLFYINKINIKTKTAFVSTILSLLFLLFFILIMTDTAAIHGFSDEEIQELSMFSLYIGVDFARVAASVIIMTTIGAITDTSIAISSPMKEICDQNPHMNRKDLFLSGMSIGRDILGTSTNTLFFAFFGGYLAMLIWFKDLPYSAGEFINSKVFSAEMITILSAGIGVTIVIPITSWITSYYLVRRKTR